MSVRAGVEPRNMTMKLLPCLPGAAESGESVVVPLDQVALTAADSTRLMGDLSAFERSTKLDLVVTYDAHAVRVGDGPFLDVTTQAHLRRLGIVRGRPGIGFPAAVHLERFAAPGRVLVTDDPRMSLLGGLGVLVLVTTAEEAVQAIATGTQTWTVPRVLQVLLSGRLGTSISARDVGLELLRQGIRERVSSLTNGGRHPVVVEFTGLGLKGLSVQERALLCSMAPEFGATAALSSCDEKTETFLRDQRRSKAQRQLFPDAGCPSAEVLRLELGAVSPLIQLHDGQILELAEREYPQVPEVIIGGDVAGTLRDMLSVAQVFKSKRSHLDVDLVIVPSTRQTLEAMVADGTLSVLLSAGARLLPPDPRLLDGTWQVPVSGQLSARSFTAPTPPHAPRPSPWTLASVETLCQSAVTGRLQDPRLQRRTAKVTCPRELPIDDSWLFDRKPSVIPPPPAGPRTLPPPATAPSASEPNPSWLEAPTAASS